MKKSILMMLAAATIVSCSQGETNETPDAGNDGAKGVAIQLSSTHKTISTDDTRAPYEGAISATNKLTARVLATKTSANYSAAAIYANGEMTFVGGSAPSSYNTGSVTADKAVFPSDDTEPLYLAGLYPITGWTINAEATTKATIDINGKRDVMAAAEVSTSADAVKEGEIKSLTFKHLLTLLKVSLKAKSNAAAGKWGKVTKIELFKVSTAYPASEIEVDLKAGAKSGTTIGTSAMPLWSISETAGVFTYTDAEFISVPGAGVTLTETATPAAYTMIAPLAAAGATDDDLEFRVYTESGGITPVPVKVKLPYVGETTGRSFNILFTFDADTNAIQATATVVEWVFSGDVEKVIE